MFQRKARFLSVTCTRCGREARVSDEIREVVCECGRRYDPASRPTVADPFLGNGISGYRFDSILGSGGMGTVYRATQMSLNRPVAIKLLPLHLAAGDPRFVARFHREAQVLASLSHPNIVQVFDRGEHQGRYFIVMELVEGDTTLRTLVQRGPVPPERVYRIVGALLRALDYAHGRGVVHRDIKPENILITPDGGIKVADFGLSRVLGEEQFLTRLTGTRLVPGAYEYMAPEQREGADRADPRADIYSSAVVLYELLTGKLPLGRFELPSRRLAGADARIDRVVERGLAQDPDRRYESASAMGRELEALEEGAAAVSGGPAVPGGCARKKRAPQSPTVYDMRLDLLLTVLSVCGIALSVVGIGLLVAGEGLDIGAYDIDPDVAGGLVLIFGVLLWNSAERARRFRPGARTVLLALTLLSTPTIAGIPFAIWAWVVFLSPGMRVFYAARYRGMDTAGAASVAHGLLPLPPRRWVVLPLLRKLSALVALVAGIGWAIMAASQPRMWMGGPALVALIVAIVALGASVLFGGLSKKL